MFRNIFTINWFYSIIDYIFFIKLKIQNIYSHYFIENEFKLNSAVLYTDLQNYKNVTYEIILLKSRCSFINRSK